MTHFVRNELLCFVAHHLERASTDEIATAVTDFYAAEAIRDAKKMLWEEYKEDLPQIEKRTNHSRPAHYKETEDIVKGLDIVLNKHAGENLPVAFVAENLNQLPRWKPGELNPAFLCERIAALERQMQKLLEDPASVLGHNSAHNASSPMHGHPPPPPPRPDSNEVADARNLSLPPPLTSPTRSYADVSKLMPPPVQSGPSMRVRVPSARAQLPPLVPADVDRDGFTMVHNNKKKRPKKQQSKAVFGTKTDCNFKSGHRRTELFVFRVHPDVTAETMKGYIEQAGVTVAEIERLSTNNTISQSFRVLVGAGDPDNLLTEEFWPSGVGCRRFFKKRNEGSGRPMQATSRTS